MGVCYIVGASNKDQIPDFHRKNGDLVIAADGGYDLLRNKGIDADILLGDFDSLNEVPEHKCIMKFPVEKDETDSFIAYKIAYEKGYKTFIILGGIGGRFDHTLANIQMLANMSVNGARGFLIGDNTIITAITNSEIQLNVSKGGTFGVFAHGGNTKGVFLEGAKYSLENGELTSDFPLGVSNEFISDKVKIRVEEGTLVLVWYQSFDEFVQKMN